MEYFQSAPAYASYVWWMLATLFLGGFVFGPLMQWYAFNA
jgi:hypothetical protein